jgi:hypothetical protein
MNDSSVGKVIQGKVAGQFFSNLYWAFQRLDRQCAYELFPTFASITLLAKTQLMFLAKNNPGIQIPSFSAETKRNGVFPAVVLLNLQGFK